MKAKIGDWVRFLQNNTFVIGKVEYLGRKHDTMGARYHTDVGSVFDEYVLEVRSADAQATVEALQRVKLSAHQYSVHEKVYILVSLDNVLLALQRGRGGKG